MDTKLKFVVSVVVGEAVGVLVNVGVKLDSSVWVLVAVMVGVSLTVLVPVGV